MKKSLLFFIITFIFTACEKPAEIKEIPYEYIGTWKGKIDVPFHQNVDAILTLEKDSMNIMYEVFDSTYKIPWVVGRIEKTNSQKCESCNNEVVTLIYQTEDADSGEMKPYIDKLWLSGRSKTAFNLLHIDQSELYKSEIKTWTRIK